MIKNGLCDTIIWIIDVTVEKSGASPHFRERRINMGYFAALRERIPAIRFLVNAQKTVWYPILFAVLSVFSGTNGCAVYLPILFFLCATVLFAVLFTDDNIVFLTPLLMIYYSLGFDTSPYDFYATNGDMLAAFDPTAFKYIIVCAVITVGAFLARLIFDGSVSTAFKKRGLLSFSILALAAAYVMNGAFSAGYEIANLGHGLFIAFGIVAVYFLAHGMLNRSGDVLPYACKILVCLSHTVILQLAIVTYRAIKQDIFLIGSPLHINRGIFSLTWGVTTVVGAVIVLGIPAALYLAKKCKLSFIPYLSAVLFLGVVIFISARSATIVGGLILLFCSLLCCIHGKNKLPNLINLILFIIIPTVLIIIMLTASGTKLDFAEILTLIGTRGDSGRIELWKNGISDFLSSPLFGVGFNDGGYVDIEHNNIFSKMYHCLGIEFLGAMGIFGCLAFVLHVVALFRLFFKKFSVNKMMALLIPAMIIGMTIVDNFFFYLNFQIAYSVFLVIAEKQDSVTPSVAQEQQ